MNMKLTVIFCIFALVVGAGSAISAALNFTKPLPSATHGTLGVNQQLEIQKAAMEEIRARMENWAVFTGYSSGTSR